MYAVFFVCNIRGSIKYACIIIVRYILASKCEICEVKNLVLKDTLLIYPLKTDLSKLCEYVNMNCTGFVNIANELEK